MRYALLLLFLLVGALPARADDAVPPGGQLYMDFALKAEVGNYRVDSKQAIALHNGESSSAVVAGDAAHPVKCVVTVQTKYAAGDRTIPLRIVVTIDAGADHFTRTINTVNPIEMQSQMSDESANANQKFALYWIVRVRKAGPK